MVAKAVHSHHGGDDDDDDESVYIQDSPCNEAQRGDTVRLNPAGDGRLGDVMILSGGLESSADYFRAVSYRVTTEGEQTEPSYFILTHLDLTPVCGCTHQHIKQTMLLLTTGFNTEVLYHTYDNRYFELCSAAKH